jgi:tRNA pseudouridine55 synthase
MAEHAPESGVLLVDKAPDWTSHDVVNFIRRFGFKKVGHCGTLDPAATGLLILVIGRATKLSSTLSGDDKRYSGTIRLGIETDSQDAQGKVVAEHDWSHVSEADLRQAFAAFVGEQQQIPPMVSAIKIRGKKLYEHARKGEVIDRPPRDIVIHSIDVSRVDLPEADFDVKSSKGTYIRTLCADVGSRLGCGAHLQSLRRTESGRFSVDNAFPILDIKGAWNRETVTENMIPLEQLI